MAMTAASTQPIQTQQMAGAPPAMQPSTAATLLQRKKKPKPMDGHDHRGSNMVQPNGSAPSQPTADILMRGKK